MTAEFDKKKKESLQAKGSRNLAEVIVSPFYLRKSSPSAPPIFPSVHIESGVTSGPITIDDVDVLRRIEELESEVAELQWQLYSNRE